MLDTSAEPPLINHNPKGSQKAKMMEYEKLDAEDAADVVDAATRLKNAREAKGMTIEQVAAKTRITARHLELIETGQFASLPGRTYAIGFARNYARVVGEDELEIAEAVRGELPSAQEVMAADRMGGLEPGDPGKIPSRGLVWLSLIAVVLLGAGAYTFYTAYYGTGASPASLIEDASTALAGSQEGDEMAADDTMPAAASDDAPVVFTALEGPVWVRFYDGAGNVLLEKQMVAQESWTVPQDAVEPQIRTSRPDALAITIGGRSVPKLGDEPLVVSDIGVSAAQLLARDEVEEPDEITAAQAQAN